MSVVNFKPSMQTSGYNNAQNTIVECSIVSYIQSEGILVNKFLNIFVDIDEALLSFAVGHTTPKEPDPF